ncbi:MAG: hypothetical protein ABIU84_06470, partial [Thermoanaerobaculia bacterium]
AAAALGGLRAALSGRWPAPDQVAHLYGSARLESRRIAIGIAANEARNRLVVRRTHGRSLDLFSPLVEFEDEAAVERLRAPVVLVTAHVGALYLLSAGLDRLSAGRLALRWSPLHRPSASEENAFTSGPLLSRTEVLRRALESLRSGKHVVTALEGPHGSSEPCRLLGRRLDLGRGGFALARAAGVAVTPVAALWSRSQVRIAVGPPYESTLAAPAQVARWFEEQLRRSPHNLGLGLLRRLLEGPALESPSEHTVAF